MFHWHYLPVGRHLKLYVGRRQVGVKEKNQASSTLVEISAVLRLRIILNVRAWIRVRFGVRIRLVCISIL